MKLNRRRLKKDIKKLFRDEYSTTKIKNLLIKQVEPCDKSNIIYVYFKYRNINYHKNYFSKITFDYAERDLLFCIDL